MLWYLPSCLPITFSSASQKFGSVWPSAEEFIPIRGFQSAFLANNIFVRAHSLPMSLTPPIFNVFINRWSLKSLSHLFNTYAQKLIALFQREKKNAKSLEGDIRISGRSDPSNAVVEQHKHWFQDSKFFRWIRHYGHKRLSFVQWVERKLSKWQFERVIHWFVLYCFMAGGRTSTTCWTLALSIEVDVYSTMKQAYGYSIIWDGRTGHNHIRHPEPYIMRNPTSILRKKLCSFMLEVFR